MVTGATTVPIATASFSLESHDGSGNVLRNRRVELTYTYEGLPADNEFRLPLRYDFDRTAQGWIVAGARVQVGAQLPAWASGPTLFERTEHFLALYRPELDTPSRVLTDAEQARTQLGNKLPFPLDDAYLLLIAGDETQYRAMAGTTLGPVSPIAQVETSYEVTPHAIRVLARQMVINREKLYESGQTLETLRHELGHFLLAGVTRPFTPAWVSEAAAMYLAGTRPADIWRNSVAAGKFQGISINRLTRASSLGEHGVSREGTSLEYAYSAAAGWYLIETYGAQRFWDFYASYADLPAGELYDRLPDRTTEVHNESPADDAIEDLAVQTTGGALSQFFGLSPSDLDARLLTWMARQ